MQHVQDPAEPSCHCCPPASIAATMTARFRCGIYARLPGHSEPSCRCRPADNVTVVCHCTLQVWPSCKVCRLTPS